MASSRAILAMGLLAAVLSPALSKRSFISMPADVSSPVTLANGLSYGYHANSCPQLQDIVWPIVESAVLGEVAIAAGLLRIFFHDCFPQGCDASVLLTGPNSERDLPPNQTLQPRAMQLIEDVRVKVHAACGATVSCADIIALATRDAVFVPGKAKCSTSTTCRSAGLTASSRLIAAPSSTSRSPLPTPTRSSTPSRAAISSPLTSSRSLARTPSGRRTAAPSTTASPRTPTSPGGSPPTAPATRTGCRTST
ncbi:unnamed protein product [Triticum turgidum subsp. durum]|uniref:Plant heme peroxidase family profile domain-containing protein n=1 Tax=Triticum turgidum subsp. durum TaxID=4567 RepID=A0A9R0UU24_TRITD|nr:unnamed protein product [Triticum turgidum subsp. durum]